MLSRRTILSTILAIVFACATAVAAEKKLTTQQIVARGKAATALVETGSGRSRGSVFCLSESGVFLTSYHTIRGAAAGKIRLILAPGGEGQQVLTAKVIMVDTRVDLALLQVNEKVKLPVLKLSTSRNLFETQPIYCFGFPFGKALSFEKDTFPAISVNVGRITALRKKEGELVMMQIDAALNPGNAGGPILSDTGEVVGITNSGLRGRRINFATPTDKARWFLGRVVIRFTPPKIDTTTVFKEVTLDVHVDDYLPSSPGTTRTLSIQITLQPTGQLKVTRKLKAVGKAFQLKAALVKRLKGPLPQKAKVQYLNGAVAGRLDPVIFETKDKKIPLADVIQINGGLKPWITLRKGRRIVSIDPKTPLLLTAGPHKLKLDLSSPSTIRVTPPAPWPPRTIGYTLIAKRGVTQVAQSTGSLWIASSPSSVKSFLVADRAHNRVAKYSAKGKILWEYRGERDPVDAVALPDGNILVTCYRANKLVLLSPDGKKIRNLGHYSGPTGAVMLPNGNFLIAEHNANRLTEITPAGKVVARHLSGQIRNPHGLRLTPDGRVFIAETRGRRVSVWNWQTKQMVWTKPVGGDAESVAELKNGYIAVVVIRNSRRRRQRSLRVYDKNGVEKWHVDMAGTFQDVGVSLEGNAIVPIRQRKDGKDILALAIYSPDGTRLRSIPLDGGLFNLTSVRPVP